MTLDGCFVAKYQTNVTQPNVSYDVENRPIEYHMTVYLLPSIRYAAKTFFKSQAALKNDNFNLKFGCDREMPVGMANWQACSERG